MKPLYVYIAGPYTAPNPVVNTREAIIAGERVRSAGHYPFVPHLNLLWELIQPLPYACWLDLDIAFLKKCDALIRLPGHSPGADREVDIAEKLYLAVYSSVDLFLAANVLPLGDPYSGFGTGGDGS
jgi:hypothetical protein